MALTIAHSTEVEDALVVQMNEWHTQARRLALEVAHLWPMPDITRRYLETADPTLQKEAELAAFAAGEADEPAARIARLACNTYCPPSSIALCVLLHRCIRRLERAQTEARAAGYTPDDYGWWPKAAYGFFDDRNIRIIGVGVSEFRPAVPPCTLRDVRHTDCVERLFIIPPTPVVPR